MSNRSLNLLGMCNKSVKRKLFSERNTKQYPINFQALCPPYKELTANKEKPIMPDIQKFNMTDKSAGEYLNENLNLKNNKFKILNDIIILPEDTIELNKVADTAEIMDITKMTVFENVDHINDFIRFDEPLEPLEWTEILKVDNHNNEGMIENKKIKEVKCNTTTSISNKNDSIIENLVLQSENNNITECIEICNNSSNVIGTTNNIQIENLNGFENIMDVTKLMNYDARIEPQSNDRKAQYDEGKNGMAEPKIVSNGELNKTKKHFCIYCKQLRTKLPRHLETVHNSERDVVLFLALPKLSKERRLLIDEIRNRGNYEYNTTAYNSGQLIVSRRPTGIKMPDSYIPCKFCKVFFCTKSIYKHYKHCGVENNVGKKNYQVEGRKLVKRNHFKANEVLTQYIFPILRPGLITNCLKYDELIVIFGNKLTNKYRQVHLRYHIRQILRTMSRFLICIKDINPKITDLASIYNPCYYDDVLKCVNILAELNSKTNEYEKPSLATRLGNYIKKCGKILIVECIKKMETVKRQQVGLFLEIHEEEYGNSINKTATETLVSTKRNKPIDLPLQDDVNKLVNYINLEMKTSHFKLTCGFTFIRWLGLAESVLMSIFVFNRKRSGEIERLLVSDFQNRQCIDKTKDADLYRTLTKTEQLMAERYVKVELRGKLSRTVPILLNHNQIQLIQTLIEYREQANVSVNNPYIFGLHNDNYIRACEVMRKYSKRCGALHPENLRGTKLRKQMATMVQLLNLEESEISQLANFMGHDISIHKNHYRLPSTALQIGKLSKLLIMMEDGDASKKTGKSLDQLDIDKAGYTNFDDETRENHTTSNSLELLDNSDNTSDYQPLNDNINNDSTSESSLNTPKKRKTILVSKSKSKSDNYPEEKNDSSNDTENIIRKKLDDSDESESEELITLNKAKKRRLAEVSPCRKNRKITWNTPERQLARKLFRRNLSEGMLPSLTECSQAINKYDVLKRRTAMQLKAWVNNQIRKTNR